MGCSTSTISSSTITVTTIALVTITSLLAYNYTITPTCACPAETIVTTTRYRNVSSTCRCDCPLETIVTTTLPCYGGYGGYCPQAATVTVTKGASNSSTHSTSSSKPVSACSLPWLPGHGGYTSQSTLLSPPPSTNSRAGQTTTLIGGNTIGPSGSNCQNDGGEFYIRNSDGYYFTFDPNTNQTTSIRTTDGATAFNDFYKGGQLGFMSSSASQSDDFAAWVPLSGGQIQFLSTKYVPSNQSNLQAVVLDVSNACEVSFVATHPPMLSQIAVDSQLNKTVVCSGALGLCPNGPCDGCVVDSLTAWPASSS